MPVPPGKPVIFDEKGKMMTDVLGPYREGEELIATCISTGGKDFFYAPLHKLNNAFLEKLVFGLTCGQ